MIDMGWRVFVRRGLYISGVVALAIEAAGFCLALGEGWVGATPAVASVANEERPEQLEARNKALKRRLAGLFPKGVHLVVDTAKNVLYVKNEKKVVREAVVSSGSGSVLIEPTGKRTWTFDTPRGEYVIESKIRHPVWVKPEWAFIEEGKAFPKRQKDRIEAGVLGDFAMGFGASYFIHGTLYTRLLGKNVTHGCVRLGDDDLKAVYQTTDIGTRLYIY